MFEPGGSRQQPEIKVEEIINKIGAGIGRFAQRFGGGGMKLIGLGAILLLTLLWMGTGVYTVGPRERAALQLFGAFQTIQGPGLHWYFPGPIGKKTIVDVMNTRSMELGFFTTATGTVTDQSEEALMITGDLNIVNVQMVVQYKIGDLAKYLFRVDDPGETIREIGPGLPDGRTLKDATEAALRQVVGQRSIDDILVTRREEVESDTSIKLQEILDEYEAGLQILNVALQTVRPPDEVRAAFDDVVNARVDKESRINEANAYEQDRLPKAQGEARVIIQGAEAFKAEKVAIATGEADRFASVLEEYNKSKEVTRQRLYLEAMEEILPGVKKFILTEEANGNLLQFLPLTDDADTKVVEP